MENKEQKKLYRAADDETMRDSYIDIDEPRERVLADGKRMPYRYVHGGFKENKIKFSFCFPPKEDFRGRFFQYLSPFPGPDEEMVSLGKTGEDDKIAFCLQNGAYFVESNMGSGAMFGARSDAAMCYRASAAVAEYSRVVAMEYYGCARPYGYVFGGSGGGYKTMACIENTDAFDGAVPYVIGSPVSLPNTITMHAQGQRVLRHAFPKILDALDAGGSGDAYRDLSGEEAAMLRELTGMGFPPISWFPEAWGIIDDGSLPVLTPGVKSADPTYFEEFWTVPGYEGADPDSGAVRDRLVFSGVVKSVHAPGDGMDDNGAGNGVDDAWRKMLANGSDGWVELEEIPEGNDLYLKGVNICMTSGEAKGKQMLLDNIIPSTEGGGGILTIGMCYGMDDLAEVVGSIHPGDTLTLDNSDYIAIQSYYRHQVPDDPSFHAWDQFRGSDGKAALPQRAFVMGYGFTGTGTVQDGNIQGKVIVLQSLMDESTCPWCGDWYRNKVKETKGSEDDFRIYYMDRCLHGDVSTLQNNMIINYVGALQQALLDVSDWVERGIEPPPSTNYEMKDNQIIVPDRASERKGIQPVVRLTADGKDCVKVKAGDAVRFQVEAQTPENTGEITHMYLDFEEIRELPSEKAFQSEIPFVSDGSGGATSEATHSYDVPGVYFASVRVKAQRGGDAETVFTQISNLARVRVIVEA